MSIICENLIHAVSLEVICDPSVGQQFVAEDGQ